MGNVGGNMFRYKVILTTYTNCDNTSQVPYPEDPLQIGVYNYNNASPNADKQFYTSITVNLVDTTLIQPALPNNCTVGLGTCIIEGVYEGFVDVPLSFSGYYLFYERCCRNNGIVNLITDQSSSFLAFIPPTLVNNSSPTFTDLPTPFLCAGDTTTILNTAVDPDGDQLIFSFVIPYNGFADVSNPAPAPPNPLLTWPVPNVIYNPGYSVSQPYGAGGQAYINGATGLTEYMAPAIGKYVVAIEIKEYRNGNLIGITRRDLQILVINCPSNPAPNLSSSGGSGQTNYTITEGQTLCFPITFYDLNGDSIDLAASGQIFNNTLVNPSATITTPVSGDSIVTTNFCWTTACGQAKPLPYLFNVSVPDDGCPPKTTNVVYSILVNPPPNPTSITGLPSVCQNSSNTYTTPVIAGATYSWSVTGGTITSGGTGNSITVNWGSPGSGIVSVAAVSSFGCLSTPFTMNITIIGSPATDAGPDKTICLENPVQIGGTPTGPVGAIFSWSPATGLSAANIANPTASPSITTTYVVTVNTGSSCLGTDTVVVFVGSNGSANAGTDVGICLGNNTQLNASGGVSYSWLPVTGLSNSSIANPIANPIVTTTYTVTVTDAAGCLGTDNITVTVNSNPVVDAGTNTSICTGASVTIGGAPTGPAGSTYSWLPSSTLNNSSTANPVATPLVTTTYTVTVSNGGCVNTGSITITLMSLPTADAGIDATICTGGSTQLTASGGATYSWLPVTGLSDPNISNPVANPVVTTTYYVTVGWANPCINTDSVVVTVNPLPLVNAGNDVGICLGNNTALNATGGVTYSWLPITGLSNPNIANPIANPIVTTTYTVTATDAAGCSGTDTITVTVNSNPVVDAGTNTSICTGTSVTIGGSPTGPAGSTYSWAPSATLNNASTANPVATPLVNTTYTVTVTNGGCINTGSITITLMTLPIANAGIDDTICIGGNTQLTASGGTSYSWLPVTGLSNPNIFNPVANPIVTTSYYVTVTGANTCTNKDTVIVNVNPLPFADAGADVWLCPGDNTFLNASGGIIYSWSPVTYLSDPNISNPIANPVDSTIYYVTVTDVNGCSKMDSVAVFINKVVPTNAGPDKTICKGDTTLIGGAPTSPIGTTFSWSPAGSLDNSNISNPKAFPLTTTTYYVTTANDTCSGKDSITVFVNIPASANAGSDATICLGGSTQLSASGGNTYSWSPITGLNNPTIFNPIASPAITTTYTVSIIDNNGCSNSDSITVFVNPLPVIDAGTNAAICLGDSITLNATGGISYTWSPTTGLNNSTIFNPVASPNNTITYYVTATDLNTCTNTDSVIITVNSLPIADAGNDTMMCIGNSVQLNASGGISYLWSPSATLNNSTISNPLSNSLGTITYSVSVTDANGCKNTDSVQVIVNPLPTIDAGIASPICSGDSIQLNATGGTSYVWSPVTNLSNVTIADPFADPVSTTEYFVTGTDANSCVNSDSVTVVVNALPIVDAGFNTAICLGDSVTLNATGGISYSWSPANGLSNTGIFNPIASPNNTTIYYVTAIDITTCTNTDSVIITINQLPIANAGNDTMMCIGNSIQLNASGGISYLWTPSASLNNSAIANPFSNSLSTITYSVSVTDANGCVNTDSVQVTVNPLPAIDAGTALPICIGDSIQLNASGGTGYVWSPVTSLSNPNSANPFAYPIITSEYFVTGTDVNSCVNIDSVTIIVNPLPVITIDGGSGVGLDINICRGDTATLLATGGVGYIWTPSTTINNSNSSSPEVYPDSTLTYFVSVTDVNGCVNKDSIHVNVFRITVSPDTSICEGDSVQLFAIGPNALSYIWSPATGLNNPASQNPMASPSSSTTYTVSATDINQCSDVNTVSVTVNINPTAAFSVVYSPSCSGILADFTNESINADSYIWNFGDGSTSSQFNVSHIFPYNATFIATLIAINNSNCSDTLSLQNSINSFQDYFTISVPNIFTPNDDGINDQLEIKLSGDVSDCFSFTIFDRWGLKMFSSKRTKLEWDGRTTSGLKVVAGTYFYVLEINEIQYKGFITVLE